MLARDLFALANIFADTRGRFKNDQLFQLTRSELISALTAVELRGITAGSSFSAHVYNTSVLSAGCCSTSTVLLSGKR